MIELVCLLWSCDFLYLLDGLTFVRQNIGCSPTFYRICKKKDVEEFQPYPYAATVLNCLFWILYGLPIVKPDSTLVVTINSVGLVFELIYLSIFCIFDTQNKGRVSHRFFPFQVLASNLHQVVTFFFLPLSLLPEEGFSCAFWRSYLYGSYCCNHFSSFPHS